MRALIAASIALAVAATPLAAQSSEEDRIREAFAQFRQAVVGRNGATASALVSEATVDYFERIQELALYAAAEELNAQRTVDSMQALMLRLALPAAKLREMTGTTLLTRIFDQGWSHFAMVDLGDVRIEGARATADATLERSGILAPVRFTKEDGSWRLDLLSILEAASATLDLWHKQSGLPREVFLLTLLADGQQHIDDSIWQPPMKR